MPLSSFKLKQFFDKLNFLSSVKLFFNSKHFHNQEANIERISELNKYKNGLADHFLSNVHSNKTHVERKRRSDLEKLSKRLRVSFIITIICIPSFIFATSYLMENGYDADFAGILFAPIFISFRWAFGPSRKYRSYIKRKVFGSIVSFLGNDFIYKPDGKFLKQKVHNTDIIPSFDHWKEEDYIAGYHQDVLVEVEEATLTEERGSGRNRRTITKFRGLMILASMNKNFSGKTSIHADSGKIGNWVTGKLQKNENVKLEDSKFEKEFEVYSTDQIEARYLLTTAFMERLLELKNHFEDLGKSKGDFQCSFFDDKIFLMVPCGKNMFEPSPIYEAPLQVEEVINFLEEMQLIYKPIDILKLNMKIGL